MKRKDSKLRSTKGIVFTLDAVVGFMLVLLLLSISSSYVARGRVNMVPELQLVTVASDVLRVLDQDPSHVYDNAAELQNKTAFVIPPNYNFELNITFENRDPIISGGTPPIRDFISVQRHFVAFRNGSDETNIAQVTLTLWLK